MRQITIEEFLDLKGKYQGYIWLSDADKPVIIKDNICISTQMPKIHRNFMVEALLYNKGNEKSIHLTHTQRYHINEFDLSIFRDTSDCEYIAHKLTGYRKIKFTAVYEDIADELCEGMFVSTRKFTAFTGLIN